MLPEAFKDLLLEMPQQRSVEGVLDLVTRRVAEVSGIALARIWLVQPGDLCDTGCGYQATCPQRRCCLHLVSSAGRSLVPGEEWTRLDGSFRRFPFGVRKVGRIAASGEPFQNLQMDPDADWVADPGWIRREAIVSFSGQPLVFRGEVLGVLALFARSAVEESTLLSLRMIADHLASAIANARSFQEIEELKRRVEIENSYLRREVEQSSGPNGIIACSQVMRDLLRKVSQVAPTDANILITGESGTGKELLARELCARSRRSARPLIKVNCAAIPTELFESEFFGHARGAFTGAARERFGLFQAADGGTLFLDEVSEIPLELQGKLLRVIQEREYRRVGEEQERRIDVRIISASNRDLPEDVRAGRFREDLYYRLQVFPFELPPLRDRRDDIAPLAAHFLALSARSLDRPGLALTERDVEILRAYDWPGNIRELQNVIARAVITARGGRLGLEIPAGRTTPAPRRPPPRPGAGPPDRILSDAELRRLERENTLVALERCGWKVYGAGGYRPTSPAPAPTASWTSTPALTAPRTPAP